MRYLWRLMIFEPRGRESELEKWYDRLTPKQRLKVRANRLEYLVKLPRAEWRPPYFEYMTSGPCKGLSEIKIKVERNHFRLLGFFGPDSGEFTIVSFLEKKSRTLSKQDCETVKSRVKHVTQTTGSTHEWDF